MFEDRFTDKERADFLSQLDESIDVDVTDWEADFINSNLGADSFTDGQRTVIDRLIDKYRTKLKW